MEQKAVQSEGVGLRALWHRSSLNLTQSKDLAKDSMNGAMENL